MTAMTAFPRLVAVNGQCLTTDPSASVPVTTDPDLALAEDLARLAAVVERLVVIVEHLAGAGVPAEAEAGRVPGRPALTVLRGGRDS